MSDSDCNEIQGECVPNREHWRCTSGESSISAKINGVSGPAMLSTTPLSDKCIAIYGNPSQTSSILENRCGDYLKVTVKWRSPSQGSGVFDQILTYHMNPKWKRPLYQRAQLPIIDKVSSFDDAGSTEAANLVKASFVSPREDYVEISLANVSSAPIAVTFGVENRHPTGTTISKRHHVLLPGKKEPVFTFEPSWQSFVGIFYAVFDPD